MLKILQTEPLAEANVEMDDYIPFKVRFRQGIVPVPLVWQIGDAQSMLEMEIDRESQSIVAVTLTSYHKCPERQVPAKFTSLKQTSGLPVVDAASIPRKKVLSDPMDFRTDLLEVPSEFAVFLEQHRLFVVFDKESVPSCCYRVGRIGFLEGNQSVIGVALFDLSEKEKAILESHFKVSESVE